MRALLDVWLVPGIDLDRHRVRPHVVDLAAFFVEAQLDQTRSGADNQGEAERRRS